MSLHEKRINKTFDEWYEDYEGNGEELLLFNTIDLQSAFKEGYIQGITDGGIRDEVQFWKMVQERIEATGDSIPEILRLWIRCRIQRA